MNVPPIPFRLLRRAYQWAKDTAADNDHDPTHTLRDYWPECVRELVTDWREGLIDLDAEAA